MEVCGNLFCLIEKTGIFAKQIQKGMNPFSYGTIVRRALFFDRKEETKLLIDTLSGGNNVVMFAPRRYGKTSLRICTALWCDNGCIFAF